MPTLEIALLRRDGGTQPRAAIDGALIAEYAEALGDGVKFPAVVVFYDGTNYWLADGFHRAEAALRAGRGTVDADIRQGTQRDAVLFSVGANAEHGQRRTNADKRRAVETLLRDPEWSQWSDRDVARRAFVDHRFVGRLRSDLSGDRPQMRNPAEHRKESAVEPISTSSGEVRKASRNGKVYSIDTGRIGSAISKIAPQAKKLLAVSDILKDRKQVAKLAKMPRRSQVGVAERVAFGEASSLAEARDILVRSPDFEVDRFNYVLRLALKLTPDEQGRLCERLKRAIARHDGTAAPEVH